MGSRPSVDAALQEGVIEATAEGVPVISIAQASELLAAEGVPDDQAQLVLNEYALSKLQALRLGLGIIFIMGLVSLPLTRGLPREILASD